jgi:hypothetical protein
LNEFKKKYHTEWKTYAINNKVLDTNKNFFFQRNKKTGKLFIKTWILSEKHTNLSEKDATEYFLPQLHYQPCDNRGHDSNITQSILGRSEKCILAIGTFLDSVVVVRRGATGNCLHVKLGRERRTGGDRESGDVRPAI